MIDTAGHRYCIKCRLQLATVYRDLPLLGIQSLMAMTYWLLQQRSSSLSHASLINGNMKPVIDHKQKLRLLICLCPQIL